MEKGQFIVDGVKYKPKVSKPFISEILEMEDSQIKQVLVHKGDQTHSMSFYSKSALYSGCHCSILTVEIAFNECISYYVCLWNS